MTKHLSAYKLSGYGCPDQGNCNCGCGGNGLAGLGQPPVINWNTAPNTSADGREVDWTCNDWVEWHKKIAAKYGVARANEVTQQHWDRIPWYNIGMNPGCYYKSCYFYNYFREAGGGWNSILPSLFCTVDDAGGKIIESTGNVIIKTGQTAESIASAASNTSKTLGWVVPAVVVGAVGLVGYYVYKNYIKGNRQVKVGKATI